jgi:hypothetical protein
VNVEQEIEKLEKRKADNLKLIRRFESTRSLRGKVSESSLEKIAELRQANENFDETIRWLRESQRS